MESVLVRRATRALFVLSPHGIARTTAPARATAKMECVFANRDILVRTVQL